MLRHTGKDPVRRRAQIIDDSRWPRLEPRLVAGTELAGAHKERAGHSGPQGARDVGFRIVADHHCITRTTTHARNGRQEEVSGGLAQHECRLLAGEFQCGDEWASVEAELTVRILEDAIVCQRKEHGSVVQLTEGVVQSRVVEKLSRVANHHSPFAIARQVLKLDFEIGMDQEIRRKIVREQPFARCAGGRKQFRVGCSKTEARKAFKNSPSCGACRVADEPYWQFRVAQPLNRLHRPRYSAVAIIDNTRKVQKYAAEHERRMAKPA